MRHTTLALPLLLSLATLTACHSNNTTSRPNLVSLRGSPVTLEGRGVRVGQQAPEAVLVAIDMSEKRLSDYRGQTVLLSIVPSIDTEVCSRETRTFNEKAAELQNITVLTVSMDLPFAQKRWCGAHGIDRVTTLSDYKHRDIARDWGLRIRENGLLARSVYVIDANGIIRYEQIVPEVTTEPDYDEALAAAKAASKA